jgi:hypothetical protein
MVGIDIFLYFITKFKLLKMYLAFFIFPLNIFIKLLNEAM